MAERVVGESEGGHVMASTPVAADHLTVDSLRWDNPTMIVTLDAKDRKSVV